MVWRWDQQEPFGDSPANENPDNNSIAFDLPLRLPGQYYDAESGLHQNDFRDYDPSIGRYPESDPIGLRGGANTFEYGYSNPLRFFDATGLEVLLLGHLAARPLGRLTNPNSYHLALYLNPDNPCECPGLWPVTLGAQKTGGLLVGTYNYPGDAFSNATFIQTVPTPPGMTDCEFIHNLISTAGSYGQNLPYSFPSISIIPGKTDGVMAPGTYNSNSFASGVLQGAGATPPTLYTSGTAFQMPGYGNPIPIQVPR